MAEYRKASTGAIVRLSDTCGARESTASARSAPSQQPRIPRRHRRNSLAKSAASSSSLDDDSDDNEDGEKGKDAGAASSVCNGSEDEEEEEGGSRSRKSKRRAGPNNRGGVAPLCLDTNTQQRQPSQQQSSPSVVDTPGCSPLIHQFTALRATSVTSLESSLGGVGGFAPADALASPRPLRVRSSPQESVVAVVSASRRRTPTASVVGSPVEGDPARFGGGGAGIMPSAARDAPVAAEGGSGVKRTLSSSSMSLFLTNLRASGQLAAAAAAAVASSREHVLQSPVPPSPALAWFTVGESRQRHLPAAAAPTAAVMGGFSALPSLSPPLRLRLRQVEAQRFVVMAPASEVPQNPGQPPRPRPEWLIVGGGAPLYMDDVVTPSSSPRPRAPSNAVYNAALTAPITSAAGATASGGQKQQQHRHLDSSMSTPPSRPALSSPRVRRPLPPSTPLPPERTCSSGSIDSASVVGTGDSSPSSVTSSSSPAKAPGFFNSPGMLSEASLLHTSAHLLLQQQNHRLTARQQQLAATQRGRLLAQQTQALQTLARPLPFHQATDDELPLTPTQWAVPFPTTPRHLADDFGQSGFGSGSRSYVDHSSGSRSYVDHSSGSRFNRGHSNGPLPPHNHGFLPAAAATHTLLDSQLGGQSSCWGPTLHELILHPHLPCTPRLIPGLISAYESETDDHDASMLQLPSRHVSEAHAVGGGGITTSLSIEEVLGVFDDSGH